MHCPFLVSQYWVLQTSETVCKLNKLLCKDRNMEKTCMISSQYLQCDLFVCMCSEFLLKYIFDVRMTYINLLLRHNDTYRNSSAFMIFNGKCSVKARKWLFLSDHYKYVLIHTFWWYNFFLFFFGFFWTCTSFYI